MLHNFLRLLMLLAPDSGSGDGGSSGGDDTNNDPSEVEKNDDKEKEKGKEGDDKDKNPEDEKKDVPKTPAFFSQFKKENREKFKDLAKFNSLDELAEAYLNDRIPTKDASIEQIKGFLKKLGVPDSEDGYTFKDDKSNPMNAAVYKSLRTILFKNGITNRQANAIYGFLKAANDMEAKAISDARKKQADEFDSRYSALFDEYTDKTKKDVAIKNNLGHFKKFLSSTGLAKEFKDSGLIYNEKVVKALGEYQKSIDGEYSGGRTKDPNSKNGKSLFGNVTKGSDWDKAFGSNSN